MKTNIRVGIAVLSLILPLAVLATAPASITGVSGIMQNGKVSVSWNAGSEKDIAYYRVYFSRASILENGGEYDDFQPTTGKETSLTLTNTPVGADALYVAVMAVNSKGEESAYFTEEAKVTLSAASSSSAVAMPASSSAASSTATSSVASSVSSSVPPVSLLSAEAISATGVVLTFSSPITIAQADGRNAFSVQDASGAVLQLTKIVILGNLVTLWTEPQIRNMPYSIVVGDGVHGMQGNAALDPQGRTAHFFGHITGLLAASSSSAHSMPSNSTGPMDVANINLHAQENPNGTYDVTVDWRAQPGAAIASYEVRQSRDGGLTFSEVQSVDAAVAVTSIRFRNVPAGSFGVLIRTVDFDDQVSHGAFGSIVLPKTGSVTQNPNPVITGPGTKLPNSGPLLWAVLVLAGAASGAIEARRRLNKAMQD